MSKRTLELTEVQWDVVIRALSLAAFKEQNVFRYYRDRSVAEAVAQKMYNQVTRVHVKSKTKRPPK